MDKDIYARIIAALKRVPERKFRISELAHQLIDERGYPDVLKVLDRQSEVNLALAELQSYIKDVKQIRHIVSAGRSRPWDNTGLVIEPDDDDDEILEDDE